MYTEGNQGTTEKLADKTLVNYSSIAKFAKIFNCQSFYYSTITLSPSTCVLEYHIAHKIQRHTKHDQHRHKHKHTTQTHKAQTNTQYKHTHCNADVLETFFIRVRILNVISLAGGSCYQDTQTSGECCVRIVCKSLAVCPYCW